MSNLPKFRTAARGLLETLTWGEAAPEWRVCFVDDEDMYVNEPTGIAPVCTDAEHDEDDRGIVYDCCPAPLIECHSQTMAVYMAAVLNADRSQR